MILLDPVFGQRATTGFLRDEQRGIFRLHVVAGRELIFDNVDKICGKFHTADKIIAKRSDEYSEDRFVGNRCRTVRENYPSVETFQWIWSEWKTRLTDFPLAQLFALEPEHVLLTAAIIEILGFELNGEFVDERTRVPVIGGKYT